MLESIDAWDQAISLAINNYHTESADALMVAVSEKLTWLPLYLGLLLLFNKIFGWKRALIIVMAIVINLVLTDQISVLFKETLMRFRPCHEPDLDGLVRTIAGCGGKFGFVSSHAANTMGLAVLVASILKNRWMTFGLLTFALLNGYSRIYLGKHYFLDVIGGFLLGTLLAFSVYFSLQWMIKKYKL